MKYRFAALSVLGLVSFTLAQPPAGVEARLLQDLKFLTSDACEGRGIQTDRKSTRLNSSH